MASKCEFVSLRKTQQISEASLPGRGRNWDMKGRNWGLRHHRELATGAAPGRQYREIVLSG